MGLVSSMTGRAPLPAPAALVLRTGPSPVPAPRVQATTGHQRGIATSRSSMTGDGMSTALSAEINARMVADAAEIVARNAAIAAQATAASGLFARAWRPVTFCGLGDSITADGGRVWNAASAPAAAATKFAWHFWGQILSDSRAIWAGNFGLASQTTIDILNTYLPLLLAKTPLPTYCVLLIGQNDATVTSTTLSNYATIVAQLRAAGVTPILCTLTPGRIDIGIHILNGHIRSLAQTYGLPLVDLYASVIDATTGSWMAAYTRDGGVHPSGAGAAVMGQALATVLAQVVPVNANSAWLPKTSISYSATRATGTGGNTNVLLTLDDAGTPAIPTNWSILSGSHAAATSFTTPGGSIAGRKMTLTRSGANLILRCSASNGTAIVGDEFLVAFRLSASVISAGANWGLTIMDSTGASLYDLGRNNASYHASDMTDKIFMTPVVTTSTGLFVDFIVQGANGNISISEIAVVNLTGLGVSV